MKHKLIDLVDKEHLQSLMDKFLKATGTATGILDMEGNIITASGWQPICTRFHREHPEALKNCLESDTNLANSLAAGKKFNLYRCLNGLIDVATPIYINDEHVANLFIGQFLDKPPDIEFFKQQAAKYGFPEEEYLEALDKVQIISTEDAKNKMDFLVGLAKIISELGWQKLQSMETQKNLESRVKERTKDLQDAQIATLNIMQDVEEERKKTETLNEDLTKTNKELEMFAYVASHDLQEPLRKVYSFTELLDKRYNDLLDERGKKYMHYITTGAMRMQQLISDLLKFSRLGTQINPMEKVDVEKIIKLILEEYSLQIQEKQAEIKIEELPAIIADPTQMRQLWRNLIGNALKFTGEKKPVIKINCQEKSNHWIYCIIDNGIGIENIYAQKIFLIFQRLHARDKYEGTGIGLALCKKIVERHKGRIWFESKPGSGTTFYFTISKELGC